MAASAASSSNSGSAGQARSACSAMPRISGERSASASRSRSTQRSVSAPSQDSSSGPGSMSGSTAPSPPQSRVRLLPRLSNHVLAHSRRVGRFCCAPSCQNGRFRCAGLRRITHARVQHIPTVTPAKARKLRLPVISRTSPAVRRSRSSAVAVCGTRSRRAASAFGVSAGTRSTASKASGSRDRRSQRAMRAEAASASASKRSSSRSPVQRALGDQMQEGQHPASRQRRP